MNKNYRFGVMQGRLLPKYKGRYQAHPVGYWQDEFPVASMLGLDVIEFILDHNDYEINPLMTEKGLKEILAVTDKTGVGVISVCADYFMEAPIHNVSADKIDYNLNVLKKLVVNASKIGIKNIVLPCLEKANLLTRESIESFVCSISSLLNLLEKNDVNISLETELAPLPFAELIARFDTDKVTVNYDTGNSASLGFNVVEEFKCYGKKISDIHIKDRKYKSSSVILGTGDTDFSNFVSELIRIDYKGPVIMQAFRDDEGLEVFKKQFDWFKSLLKDKG
jgi:L-ribulose-5-phosphate 3-epimerase